MSNDDRFRDSVRLPMSVEETELPKIDEPETVDYPVDGSEHPEPDSPEDEINLDSIFDKKNIHLYGDGHTIHIYM